jgi:rod shape-determining protein MreC
MQNFLKFLVRYHAFFLFLALEAVCLGLFLRSAEYPQAVVLHSANAVSGRAYARLSNWRAYNRLDERNDSLQAENARLRNLLAGFVQFDTATERCFEDSLFRQVYAYLPVRVIKNSVTARNNFLTLDRGRADGIRADMGVVTDDGIVGVVVATSEHFSVAMSVLHGKFSGSAALEPADGGEPVAGRLRWDGRDPRLVQLTDIPGHVEPRPGDRVRTTGFSALFPEDWPVGTVERVRRGEGSYFLEVDVALSQDFSRLRRAYVIHYLYREERSALEAAADAL